MRDHQPDDHAEGNADNGPGEPVVKLLPGACCISGNDAGGRPDHPLTMIDVSPFDKYGSASDRERDGDHQFDIRVALAVWEEASPLCEMRKSWPAGFTRAKVLD